MSSGAQGKSTPVVAVDTGGTFTDLILLDSEGLKTLKVPSTPDDPSTAVLRGLRELLQRKGSFHLVHGSTVATNALLERKGARVFLVTNDGFQDVVEIGRQNRPELYALHPVRPSPLVDRGDRVGIGGRLDRDGRELSPLDSTELEELPDRLADAESVAVSLLHAYATPAHEEEVARVLSDLPVPVSLSSRILPEYREYERTATTVVNAYVRPVISRYLGRLATSAGAETVRIMGSDGGALSVERASQEPVHTVLSGPAGGVVAALEWGRTVGMDEILSFDMGGTSTDVALAPGRLIRTREFRIADTPVAIPLLDIHTVGAGGGSIARIDPGGVLRVGPESAGAHPGPIVYGRGGRETTVTDAHVLLGRLPPDGFLGGRETLELEGLKEAVAELSGALERSPEEAALGIISVANTAMERALRVISVDRGHDPRNSLLVAFGGAGGLHAAELAERLGMSRVLIPPDPGLLSAFGMLVAPVAREHARTVLLSTDERGTEDAVRRELDRMETEARSVMEKEGHAPGAVTVERTVDARYRGQSFELGVPAEEWVTRFHERHLERYGYERREHPLEAVTLRVRLSAAGRTPPSSPLPPASEPAPTGGGEVFTEGGWVPVRRFWRRNLPAGHRLEGPAQILEYSSTTWIPNGWEGKVHPSGALLLTRSGRAGPAAPGDGRPD